MSFREAPPAMTARRVSFVKDGLSCNFVNNLPIFRWKFETCRFSFLFPISVSI